MQPVEIRICVAVSLQGITPEDGEPEAHEDEGQGANKDCDRGNGPEQPGADILGDRDLPKGDLQLLFPWAALTKSNLNRGK